MDVMRHRSIFDPAAFEGRVGVIGVGALGSAVALNVAKLGIKKITVFDSDTVEAHNLPNQVLYGPDCIGEMKASCAATAIYRLTGTSVAIRGAVASKNDLRETGVTHVFMCVDSMAVRKMLFKTAVFMNPDVCFFAEGRLSSRTGISTAFNPKQIDKSKEYLTRLYPDEDVVQDRGACGNVLMLGATAMMLACQMTWQFINHCNGHAYNEEIAADYKEMSVQSAGNLVT